MVMMASPLPLKGLTTFYSVVIPSHFLNHSRLLLIAINRIFGSCTPCGWRGSTSIRTGTPCVFSAWYSS